MHLQLGPCANSAGKAYIAPLDLDHTLLNALASVLIIIIRWLW